MCRCDKPMHPWCLRRMEYRCCELTKKRDIQTYPAARHGAHKIYSYMTPFSQRLRHKSRQSLEPAIFWYTLGAVYFPKTVNSTTILPDELNKVDLELPDTDVEDDWVNTDIDAMIASLESELSEVEEKTTKDFEEIQSKVDAYFKNK